MLSINRRRFLAFSLSSLAVSGLARAQQLQTVRIGSAVRSVFSLPLYVADQKGYFAEEGLLAEISFFAGGPPATSALLGGSVDYISSAIENQIKLARRGQRVVSIIGMQSEFSGALVLHKSAAQRLALRPGQQPRVEDLKGLRIATLARGGFADTAARYIFANAGIDPDKEVQLIPFRGYDKVLAAAQVGEVDGALMVEPWQTIAVEGGQGWEYVVQLTVGEGPDVFRNVGYVSLQTTPKLLSANRAQAEKVVKAIAKAHHYIAEKKNLAELVAIANKVFPDESTKILRASIAKQQASFRAELNPEMLVKNTELLFKAKAIEDSAPSPVELIDTRFSGFWK